MEIRAIPFNKPYLAGNESEYILQAVQSGKISGNGLFTKKCHSFFETHYGFKKCLLTTSCTDALEMAAILTSIEPGDEVIMPSYSFVSTANAFVLRGANIIFCWISSMCSSCAYKNAAMISDGKKELPISTQLYLSTSPRKKADRFVPFSQIISALLINLSSLITSIPPSPD